MLECQRPIFLMIYGLLDTDQILSEIELKLYNKSLRLLRHGYFVQKHIHLTSKICLF